MNSGTDEYWPQIEFELNADSVGLVEEALFAAGALSVIFKDQQDEPILEPAPGETPLWSSVRVTGLYAQGTQMQQVLTDVRALCGLPLPNWQIKELPDQQWERAWMQDFHAMRFGDNLWICPSHKSVAEPDAVVIHLDPGLAFGTGTHPSTALCLEWLSAHPPANKQVIDFGCGSGVLAIAAALLGAAHVSAVDNDSQATQATIANARANAVGDRVSVCTPDALTSADLLLANILLQPLLELAPEFARLLAPGAELILAGVLVEQFDAISMRYNQWFELDQVDVKEGWVLIHGIRHALNREADKAE